MVKADAGESIIEISHSRKMQQFNKEIRIKLEGVEEVVVREAVAPKPVVVREAVVPPNPLVPPSPLLPPNPFLPPDPRGGGEK